MATQKTIEIVKSTAPVLKEHGGEITKVFYKILLEDHPELKNVFNMTHQKQGSQPKVLANAIFQYATYIDKLENLDGAVKTIVQKHVSLSIQPEMYPIVGKYLLLAIKEVLKDAATDDVINAWSEAYTDLANIFISLEEQVYEEVSVAKGGFRGQEEFIVVKKEKESGFITSFYLKNVTREEVPNFRSGQYVAISVSIPGEEHIHTRNYSLSNCNCKDHLRISVKKEIGNPDGVVSNYLHESVQVGDVLKLGVPAGDFVLQDSNNPVLLIGGGVGVTPLVSMFHSLVNKTNRDVAFVQCVVNSEHHAFKGELINSLKKNVNYLSIYSEPLKSDVLGKDYDVKGFVKSEILETYLTPDTEIYFCGPTPFMAEVLKITRELNIKPSKVNYEFFGPAEELNI